MTALICPVSSMIPEASRHIFGVAMITLRFVQIITLAALTGSGQQIPPQPASPHPESSIPPSCPVTRRPAHEFIPPAPYERDGVAFWLGTEKLWTFLPERAIWEWAPHQPGHEQEVQPLTTKIFWMRLGYDSRAKQRPAIRSQGDGLTGLLHPSSCCRRAPPFKDVVLPC